MTTRFSRVFSEADLHAFAEITRDYNPCHFEPRYCDLKGFSGPVIHGLLVGSMICEPGGQWGWLASEMNFKFLKPVYIGDTITCEITITDVTERGFARAAATYFNQRGETVAKADLAGILPSAEERKVMAVMVMEGDPTNPLSEDQ
jgi:acyl dehydratase